MKIEELKTKLGNFPIFSLETGLVLSGCERKSFIVKLSRWEKAGHITSLRRGLYGFPDKMRHVVMLDLWLANRMYGPSYVSCERALHYHNMIPEMVFAVTSVTARKPVDMKNKETLFIYRNVKPSLIWGYTGVELEEKPFSVADQGPTFIARPEKALLDYFWLHPGVNWCPERLEAELRLRYSEHFSVRRFMSYAKRFHSPRMIQAAKVALEVMQTEKESWEEVPEDLAESEMQAPTQSPC